MAGRQALPSGTYYTGDTASCRQCMGDLIGIPGEEVCGTCGLPAHDPGDPNAKAKAAEKAGLLSDDDQVNGALVGGDEGDVEAGEAETGEEVRDESHIERKAAEPRRKHKREAAPASI